MSHSRTKNNRINKIHEKALRNFYKDEKISLLMIYWKKDKSVSINQTNLYILATEIRWKVSNNLRPEIVKGIFHFVQKSYNLKMIELYKRKVAAQCTLEQKAYLVLPPKYGN